MTNILRLEASILSADRSRLDEEIASVEGAVDAVHIDVMDGTFVPHTAFDAITARNLSTTLPLDIHLMVEQPVDFIDEFLAIPVAHITFHAEAVRDTSDRLALIAAIRAGGATAGIAVNPNTPLSAIDDVIDAIDQVLLMTVEPGKGGQPFLAPVLEKIRSLRAARPDLSIQVDGGVNEETAAHCIDAGADTLVIGSALFNAPDRTALLQCIRT